MSIIGLRYVIQPSSPLWRRLVWLALILAGTGFTIFQIQDRVSFYLSSVTQSRSTWVLFYLSWPTNVGTQVQYVDSMRFPTVTFCNENRVMKSSLIKTNSSKYISQRVVFTSEFLDSRHTILSKSVRFDFQGLNGPKINVRTKLLQIYVLCRSLEDIGLIFYFDIGRSWSCELCCRPLRSHPCMTSGIICFNSTGTKVETR
jgi:Amiloride-sensitive sodium channel